MSYSKLSRILEIDISKDPKMMLDEIAKLGKELEFSLEFCMPKETNHFI